MEQLRLNIQTLIFWATVFFHSGSNAHKSYGDAIFISAVYNQTFPLPSCGACKDVFSDCVIFFIMRWSTSRKRCCVITASKDKAGGVEDSPELYSNLCPVKLCYFETDVKDKRHCSGHRRVCPLLLSLNSPIRGLMPRHTPFLYFCLQLFAASASDQFCLSETMRYLLETCLGNRPNGPKKSFLFSN